MEARKVVVCVGTIGLLATLGIWAWQSTKAPQRVSTIPADRVQEVRRLRALGRAAPLPGTTLPPDQVARIGTALGGFLVRCALDPTTVPRGLSPLRLQGQVYWQVPASSGARPLVEIRERAVQTVGAMRWSGATSDRIGNCVIRHGVARVAGTVTKEGVGTYAILEICGTPIRMETDGSFVGELPLDAQCDVAVRGHRVRPQSIHVRGDVEDLRIELLEFSLEAPSAAGFLDLASTLLLGPDLSGPGKFERALDARGLTPETREWLEWQAAAERVALDDVSTLTGRGWLLWELVR